MAKPTRPTRALGPGVPSAKSIIEAYFMHPDTTGQELAHVLKADEARVREVLAARGLPLPHRRQLSNTIVDKLRVRGDDREKVRDFAARYHVTEAEALKTFLEWGLER